MVDFPKDGHICFKEEKNLQLYKLKTFATYVQKLLRSVYDIPFKICTEAETFNFSTFVVVIIAKLKFFIHKVFETQVHACLHTCLRHCTKV